MKCCDGTCVDILFNDAHCGGYCEPCPAGRECCHGRCIDPQYTRCCRDHPNAGTWRPWCPAARSCCMASNGGLACC
jgi:hypothetical protein